MTYSQFIDKLRIACGDLPTLTQDKWNGDASTVAFRTTFRPILNDSYDVFISDVQQTETTDYVLDKDTGLLDFTAGGAPASGTKNIKMNYKYAFLRDDEWIDIINNVLSCWRRKLFTIAFDETTASVADKDDYDLDSISSNIIWVTGVWRKKSADIEWISASTDRNITYYDEQNILNIRPTFSTADYYLRIQYLKAYTLGTTAASTFEPADKYYSAITKACQAEYWERFATAKLKETSAVAREESYEPAVQIMNMALKLRQLAEEELSKIKPRFPETSIKNIVSGISS
jgi:hypothetical protein